MTWTYQPTDVSTTLAKVRLIIGDTNNDEQLLSDEEIAYFTGRNSDVFAAALEAIRYGILPKLARDIDRNNLGMSATRSQKVQHYKDLADSLASSQGILPPSLQAEGYAGGQSLDEREDNETDSDMPQPRFTAGRDDNTDG